MKMNSKGTITNISKLLLSIIAIFMLSVVTITQDTVRADGDDSVSNSTESETTETQDEESVTEEQGTSTEDEVTEEDSSVGGQEESSTDDSPSTGTSTRYLTAGTKDKYGNNVDDIGRLYNKDGEVIGRDVVNIADGKFIDENGYEFTLHGTRYNADRGELYGNTLEAIAKDVDGVTPVGVPFDYEGNFFTVEGHRLLTNGNVEDINGNIIGTFADSLNSKGQAVDANGEVIILLTPKQVNDFGLTEIDGAEPDKPKHDIKILALNIMVSVIVGVLVYFVIIKLIEKRREDREILEEYLEEHNNEDED